MPRTRPARRLVQYRIPAWRVYGLDPGRLLAVLFGGGLAALLAAVFLLVGLSPLVEGALSRALSQRR